MKSNVYCAEYQKSIIAGATESSLFKIPAPQRRIFIKRVTIDWDIAFTISNLRIDFSATTTQRMYLAMGAANAQNRSFIKVAGGTFDPITNGGGLVFRYPGQYNFDKVSFENEMLFYLFLYNYEAALAVFHNFNLEIETEEEIVR